MIYECSNRGHPEAEQAFPSSTQQFPGCKDKAMPRPPASANAGAPAEANP